MFMNDGFKTYNQQTDLLKRPIFLHIIEEKKNRKVKLSAGKLDSSP